jgi:predicted transglutaminase-like cysteine proteinase
MPKYLKVILLSLIIFIAVMPATAFAVSSAKYYEENGEVYDDWNICRTNAAGEDGFFQVSEAKFCPIILGESLGENVGKAYQIGQQFAIDYPDSNQRAEKIFAFARNKVRYTPDKDQFGYKEFARNADELALAIDDEGIGYGDCEDYAILLATMYKGAGLRSAIVLAPGHAATLVYLPQYNRANQFLSIDGESGWVWAEATGRNNPLGWMPEEFMGAELMAYEVEDEAITEIKPQDKPSTVITPQGGGSAGIHISPFFSVLAMMWLLSLFRRRSW